MIHISFIQSLWHTSNPYTNTVESFEIIANDASEVVIKIPKVSIIGMLITTDDKDTLEVYQSVDNTDYYPYCIIDRQGTNDSVIDTPKPLKIQLLDKGDYTYILDHLVAVNYIKLKQENQANAINITFVSDSVF